MSGQRILTHKTRVEIEAAHAALPEPPRARGRVVLLVLRPAQGERDTPDRVALTVEHGLVGDDWARRPPRDPAAQIAVMRADLAEAIADAQALALFGDNLLVDLDLSADNMAAGTRLSVGEALVEVTAKPHNGCKKFRERFGLDALSFVQAPATRDQNRRGVYWRVVEPGEVRVGSPIEVLR